MLWFMGLQGVGKLLLDGEECDPALAFAEGTQALQSLTWLTGALSSSTVRCWGQG